jgi:hypothetical protein
METNKVDFVVTEQVVEVQKLEDLDLALVGGGMGDVAF